MNEAPGARSSPTPDLYTPPAPVKRSWGLSRGLELTPPEVIARRKNRRWFLGIVISSVIMLVLALIASGVAESNSPSGPAVAAPPGYKAINDGYYSYVVPSGWSTNPLYTDSAGDIERSGPDGWAAEHIGFRRTAPVLGEPRPSSLEAFGLNRPEPYVLSGGHPIRVPGAAAAFSYDLTRPGGFHAAAVDAWSPRTGVELWLLVDASPQVTGEILGHLKS